MNSAMSVGTNHKPVTCFDINDLAINIELALAAQNTVDFFVLLMSMDERYCGLSRKFINRNFSSGQTEQVVQFDTRSVFYFNHLKIFHLKLLD